MAKKKRSSETPAPRGKPVVLPEDAGIRHVAELHGELRKALKRKTPVAIDGSTVRRVDAAALQLLTAFVRDRHAQDRGVLWSEPSPVLLRAAATVGLSETLGLPRPEDEPE